MAIGVPESEVFAAADAVLARGERPTVERVRQELGRGSPARVGGLLDLWWANLTQRLSGETRLPALPGEVSQAFVAVWQQAINMAMGVAEQRLAQQREVLALERTRVVEVEDQARRDSATSRQQANEASLARQAVETRLADLEKLLEQRLFQIEDLHQQREELLRERALDRQQVQSLQDQLLATQAKYEQERTAQDSYSRGVEERAHREIDRARQEAKASAAQIKTVNRQLEQLQKRIETAQNERNEALQKSAILYARNESVEHQLKLHTQINKKAATKKPTEMSKSNKKLIRKNLSSTEPLSEISIKDI